MDYDVSMNSPLPIVVFITHHANEMLWSALRSALDSGLDKRDMGGHSHSESPVLEEFTILFSITGWVTT